MTTYDYVTKTTTQIIVLIGRNGHDGGRCRDFDEETSSPRPPRAQPGCRTRGDDDNTEPAPITDTGDSNQSKKRTTIYTEVITVLARVRNN